MMSQRLFKVRAAQVAIAIGVVLQGCASAPPKPAPPRMAAPQAPEQIIQMAPIPNPEPAKPTRPSHSSASSHRTAAKSSEDAAARDAPRSQITPDHAKAVKLRAQGLEELDRGRINRAVALLQSASQLDPNDPLIQRDLQRALRISKAVHSHP